MTDPTLDQHLLALIDGETPEADAAMLRDDAEARRRYIELTMLQVLLVEKLEGETAAPVVPAEHGVQRRTIARRRWAPGLALAAAVMLAAGALLYTVFGPLSGGDPATTPRSNVAQLTDLQDAVFTNSTAPPTLGGKLAPGPIELAQGNAQIMFDSGAVVDLVGPGTMEMLTGNRARLHAGRLAAYVPDVARGFTVELPDGCQVIDVGTRFFVNAESDTHVTVGVIEGQVLLDDTAQMHTLSAGRYVTLIDRQAQTARSLATMNQEAWAGYIAESVASDALHSYFPMDGDMTPHAGPAGRLVGQPAAVADRLDQPARAMRLDGKAYLPLNIAWPADAYTVATWVKPEQYDETGYLVGVQNSGNNPGRFLRLQKEGRVQFTHVIGRQQIFDVQAEPQPLNQWVHLAATFELTAPRTGLLTLYVNGQPVDSTTIDGDSSRTDELANLTIGTRPDRPGQFTFTGALDDVIILDHALSAQQVLDLYDVSSSSTQEMR